MSLDRAADGDSSRSWLHSPTFWGVVVGVAQAATPLVLWWLDSATVYALGLVVIAAVYIGFAVADGRPKVIAVESGVPSPSSSLRPRRSRGHRGSCRWAGRARAKDLWQHRTQFVAGTRWWPPFCMAVDFVVAAIIVVEIARGMNFR